jgi:heat shock protein HtpX
MYSQIDKNKWESFLLLLLFILFTVFVSVLLGYGFTNDIFGSIFIGFIAFLFSFFSSLFTYFFGHSVVLSMTGAIDVTEDPNFKNLNDIVETLAIKAGIPKPRVHILPEIALNAYATGRNPKNGHIAITQGMLQTFGQQELEAVIAHELAHIRNFDIRLMLIVSVLAGVLTTISDIFVRSIFFGGRDNDRGGNPIVFIFAIIFAILAPIIATLIKLAVSRKREFLADASAVEITRYPDGMIKALQMLQADTTPMEKATEGNAHMFIDFPLRDAGNFIQKLFSTHPPIEDRIEALRRI